MKINTGRVALFLKHKQNYIDTCTVKSCNILEVKKALVKTTMSWCILFAVIFYLFTSHGGGGVTVVFTVKVTGGVVAFT